jgi:cyclophilin family peptidyl-prolyl cis-trans isomerase
LFATTMKTLYFFFFSFVFLFSSVFVFVDGEMQTPQRELRKETVTMQLSYGNVELGFYKDEASNTADHILKAFKLGLYDTNHVFRVDKNFVAQIADCMTSRRVGLTFEQNEHARKKIRGEHVGQTIKHRKGTLSMARFNDPDSGTTSFSILLGDAPHLDGQYCQFGELISGFEVLDELQKLETTKSGIFVMPKERIEIMSTYVTSGGDGDNNNCVEEKLRAESLAKELHDIRAAKLPSKK